MLGEAVGPEMLTSRGFGVEVRFCRSHLTARWVMHPIAWLQGFLMRLAPTSP